MPSGDAAQLLEVLCTTSRALVAVTSAAASKALAEQVCRRYRRLDAGSRIEYLRFVATEFAADPSGVKAAAEGWLADPSDEALWALAGAVEAPRQGLFRAINTAARGTETVVEFRRDVLAALRDHPELMAVERDLHHVLSSWFSRGFIELQRISWESPAEVLERIIAYEAVHEIHGWGDLRRRLEPDRRCYGFFHPALRYEPLVFVEVALTRGMVASIGEVLHAPSLDEDHLGPVDTATSDTATSDIATSDTATSDIATSDIATSDIATLDIASFDTATFYSITSSHAGLAGIPLGDFLIKQVAKDLAHELPGLERFVTLSPMPGFRSWLDQSLRHRHRLAAGDVAGLTELDDPAWFERREVADRLRPILMRLGAHYLVNAKRGRAALDPVARFHLRNGARVFRLNWLADVSDHGMRQSAGLMVNYEYDDAAVAANHETYVHDGLVVRAPEIDALLEG